jgi:hypothetical protein
MSFRTVLTLAALVSIPPAAMAVDSPLDSALQPEVTESPLVFTCRACPDARVEFRELEAARPIDWKLALAAAMRAASRSAADDKNEHFGQPGKDGRYVFANSPKEVAKVIRDGLGPTSLVTHGVDALASLADAAERTTQVPLDGLNFVTDAMVDAGRKLGWRQLPRFRLRSKIENDRAGVTLSARW